MKTVITAKLKLQPTKEQFIALRATQLACEVADPTPQSVEQVVGVDASIRYLAVSSTHTGTSTFHSGKRVRAKANHYASLRKHLQQTGTRSATRHLVAISGRERRLKQDANHVVSKRITQQHPRSLIGLEQLTIFASEPPQERQARRSEAAQSQRRFLTVVVCPVAEPDRLQSAQTGEPGNHGRR